MTAALRGAGPNTPPRNDGQRGAGRYRSRWPWLALIAIVLAVAGVAQTGPGRDLLSRLGLSVEADRYTALSFVAPSGLGEQTGDPVTAAFAIANNEGGHREYQWTVSVGDDGDRRTVTDGVSAVDDGAAIVVDPAVPNPCPTTDASAVPTRERITVSLAEPAQSIGFWLTCPATEAGS
jgi:hypothetical protein